MSDHPTSGLRLKIPAHMAVCLAVFFVVNFSAVHSMRGIGDAEGYPLNTSKLVPVNTYEDDAQVSIGHALGLFPEVKDTFSIATNFGGPLLLAAKPVMWAAAGLGFIKLSSDPMFYVAYPEELRKIWQVFAFYKLVLLMLLPLSVYWVGRNFISEATGVIAAWLIVAAPYLTAYELRLKPESIVLALTFLFILHLLQYVRTGRARNLYYSTILLGVSFSMKFTLAPAMLLVPAALYEVARQRGTPALSRDNFALLIKSAGICFGAFLVSNPLFLHAPAIFISFVNRYHAATIESGSSLPIPKSMLDVFRYRLMNFDTYLGQVLNWLVIPTLVFCAWRTVSSKFRFTALFAVLFLFCINFIFLWWVANNLLYQVLSYYFYSQAILLTFLIAAFLGAALHATQGKLAEHGACLAATVAVIVSTFAVNLDVLGYLHGPSTRQAVHAWLKERIPPGESIGIPVARQGHLGFSDRFMVDPFLHRVAPIGEKAEHLGSVSPRYAVTVQVNPVSKTPLDAPYEQILTIDTAGHLPREANSAYQDDIYTVYKLTGGETVLPPGPGDAEAALGAFVRSDPEPEFTILNYKGLSIFPLSLDLLAKSRGTVLPLPTGLFTSALRYTASPVVYVHQIPPDVLTLWGVKYILAKDDTAFRDEVLRGNRYPLTRSTAPELAGLPTGTVLYAHEGYQGRCFFLPTPEAGAGKIQSARYGGFLERHRLKPFGVLYEGSRAAKAGVSLLRVRITVECDAPADLLLKGGERPLSILLGPGKHDVDIPYRLIPGQDAGYELNLVKPGTGATLVSASAEPMEIIPAPQAQPATIGMSYAYAAINARTKGEAVFSLPWHPYWRAEVDGRLVKAQKGPGNTVAVPVEPGRHTVIVLKAS